MSSYIKALMQTLDQIDIDQKGQLTGKDVQPGETVLGTVSDEYTIRLYLLYEQVVSEHNKLVKDYVCNCCEDHCDCDSNRTDLDRLKKEYEQLKSLFWTSVRQEFNTWASNIGIRNNWQIVSLEPLPPFEDAFDNFIRSLNFVDDLF